MWIRIQRYKISNKTKGKSEFTNKNTFFPEEIIFFKSEPKKKVQSDLKIKSYFDFYKLKDILKFGDFLDLDPDPDWSNFVDPDPDTINPDPHHWTQV